MKKILLFTISIFTTSLCFAGMDVETAVKTALENNVSIARQQITLTAACRTKNHSWNSLSPSISLSATGNIPVDELTNGEQESKYSSSYSVSASASIGFSANLYTTIQAAKLAYEQSKISFNDAVRSVELSVRQSFYGLLYEKENIELQEENLKIAKQQYENNLEKYNSGRLSEIDVLSAEVNYKSKIPTVQNARTAYLNDLDNFKQVLGLKIDEEIELEGNLDDILCLKEISVNPESIKSSSVELLEKKLAAAKNSVTDKRFSAFTPSLSASLSWGDGTWYNGYDGEAPETKKSSSVKLSASIPLDGVLPWSTKNDAIDSAKDNVKDIELQLDTAKKDFIRSVESSLRSIKQSQEAVKYKQSNVVLAQKSFDMTQEAYNRGTKDLLALQNSNTTLMNSKVSLKSEILTLTKTILNLEKSIGVQFGTLTK